MRLLQVMAGAADGGAETAFADTCVALAGTGIEQMAVTRANNPRRLERLKEAGIETRTLPFGGAADVLTPFLLRRIIRGWRPDIVQTWMARAAWKTPAWRPGCGVPRYAVVSRLGGYYKLKYFRSADYFTTITPAIAGWLEQGGIDPARIRVIHNFAETEDDAAPASRAAEDTPEGATLLLALGRLHRAKAFDVLLDAVAAVPGAWLWIAGEGPDRASLEARCDALGLRGRVRFLGWRDDRAALLKAADICVFPSRHEPFGTVFAQAWAAGAPVIVSDADGPRQFVRDGEDALMVPRDDAPALAAAIRRLLNDPPLAVRLATAGRIRYLASFTRAATMEGYVRLYRDIVDTNQ